MLLSRIGIGILIDRWRSEPDILNNQILTNTVGIRGY